MDGERRGRGPGWEPTDEEGETMSCTSFRCPRETTTTVAGHAYCARCADARAFAAAQPRESAADRAQREETAASDAAARAFLTRGPQYDAAAPEHVRAHEED